ncbi:unnamed protein product [Mytilus coruscus]|uniref:Uncharacterized protein n=1 Tax=Mytilus coruscus TaxID=42192 RepID=A0A6J8BXJ5_MYTCO|nr:unnamed protein product [Mytilus coruscus]
MMNTVRDNFSHNKKLTTITSGSFGEGLQMQGSDLDIMIIDKSFEVCEDTNIPFNPEKSYFTMETDDTQPGFTQLRLLSSNYCHIHKSCEVKGPYLFFSSTAFKQVISSNALPIVHGPCMSDTHGFYDIARCLHCKSWIKPARQWVTRSNNGWPGEDVKQAIIQHGALFVPIDITMPTYTTFEHRIQIVSCIKSSKVKHLHLYYMSKICNQSGQLLPFKDTSCNKFAYKQHKITIHTLLWNVHHDAVSGWLILASFFYKTKRYNLALVILQYSLSKCTVEKFRPFMKLSQIHYELFELKLFRKMNIVQIWKFLLLDNVHFWESSTLMPDELQIKGKTAEYIRAPVVYAYFLRFLCHYHLNNTIPRCDSLRCLKLSIENNYFISNYIDKALSYNLLGLALQLTGDIESAKQAFMQSIRLVPDPDLNSAYRRLSLMS